jgi:hypothetical protein
VSLVNESVSQSVSQTVINPIKDHVTKHTRRYPDKVLVHDAMAKKRICFSGAFAKLRRETVSFVNLYAIRPTVCPHEKKKIGYHRTDFKKFDI